MEWKPFIIAFTTLFVMELGDKTQLAAAFIAADQQSPWMVWLGASLGLTLVSGIAIGIGHVLGAQIPTEIIRYVAAGLFIVMGVLIGLNVL